MTPMRRVPPLATGCHGRPFGASDQLHGARQGHVHDVDRRLAGLRDRDDASSSLEKAAPRGRAARQQLANLAVAVLALEGRADVITHGLHGAQLLLVPPGQRADDLATPARVRPATAMTSTNAARRDVPLTSGFMTQGWLDSIACALRDDCENERSGSANALNRHHDRCVNLGERRPMRPSRGPSHVHGSRSAMPARMKNHAPERSRPLHDRDGPGRLP